ncbi:MAG: SUMF1/EgtB/PvdO family nonheme iron enzyme [Kiritimatiellae bacterium]|nr:SUMF1/EgtB/PvdO family nonheme iron enzyme [Kiritimatiellia bacterium]
MLMRKIYAKDITWPMGISSDRMDGSQTYGTNILHRPHYVTLTYNYYIGIYEMTYSQYRNASSYSSYNKTYTNNTEVGYITIGGIDRDVIPREQEQSMFWPAPWLAPSDMRGYKPSYYWPVHGHRVPASSGIGLFRQRTGLDLDLPTEAEWEYACRAGESKILYTGKSFTAANVAELAWSSSNWNQDPACSSNQLHEVGLLKPNAWGLYDMLGNGFEVCLDVMSDKETDPYQIDPYKGEDVENPGGPTAEQGALAQTEGGTYIDTAGKTQYTWPNYVTQSGRRARRGGSVFDSTSTKYHAAMTFTYSRSDMRKNISYTVQYPATAYRFVLPAVIP